MNGINISITQKQKLKKNKQNFTQNMDEFRILSSVYYYYSLVEISIMKEYKYIGGIFNIHSMLLH